MEIQPKETMNVLVFETNIRYKKDITKVSVAMKEETRIHRWNVDREDASKVLRVVSTNLHPSEVINLVTTAGFTCTELND